MIVFIFCFLIAAGIAAGQAFDFSPISQPIGLVTSACLAYIMIEVGFEFSAEKIKMKDYGWDAVVAFSAAVLPALMWFGYFIFAVGSDWRSSVLSGLSSAPTSAGILFSMLSAAGLGATWVFKKARILAVLDDLVTILLLVPLQIMIHGFEWASVIAVLVVGVCVFAAFRWQNFFQWPAGEKWLLTYAVLLTAVLFAVNQLMHLHIEVLIPAFAWGCLLRRAGQGQLKHSAGISLDTAVKGLFMFLVGISFPKISMGAVPMHITVGHVLALTVLANFGKCFPVLCYRRQVPVKERLALSVAMFPRGEVGAAVLMIALGYGLSGYANTLALLSLAFNLVLTGLFIWVVTKLLSVNS